MQKAKRKQHILGKKQKQILKFLAENGPHTIYAICRKLFSLNDYHATHSAVKSLKKKGLVELVEGKYKATQEGRLTAMIYGASIYKVKENALKNCKPEDKEDLMATYEIIESVGPEIANALMRILKERIELAYVPIPLDQTEFKKILKILRKYPKWWNRIEEMLKIVE